MTASEASPRCPLCGADEVVPIRYGRPDEGLREQARRGEVVLGGTESARERPSRACKGCGWRWRDQGRPA